MPDEREPLTEPPAEENDDSINAPQGLGAISESDVEDVEDHGDDEDDDAVDG